MIKPERSIRITNGGSVNISIDDIIVSDRVRTDVQNIGSLAESMQKNGLMNPIVITDKNKLVAGFRRLQAAKSLGWKTIEASVIESAEAEHFLELELEENVQRLPFSELELAEGRHRLEKMNSDGIFSRIKQFLSDFLEDSFDKKNIKKAEKIKRNGRLSLLVPAGFAGICLAAVCAKFGLISNILHSLLDVTFFCMILAGLFFFAKYYMGKHD